MTQPRRTLSSVTNSPGIEVGGGTGSRIVFNSRMTESAETSVVSELPVSDKVHGQHFKLKPTFKTPQMSRLRSSDPLYSPASTEIDQPLPGPNQPDTARRFDLLSPTGYRYDQLILMGIFFSLAMKAHKV